MSLITIKILNPKATKLLRDLADLNLISIENETKEGFFDVVEKLRKKSNEVPDLEETIREIKLVRSKRHAK